MTHQKRWMVITPMYTDYPSDPFEPPETGCDVVEVEADTKREALVKGVRELRRSKSEWMHNQAGDKASPFAGLKVECAHFPAVDDVMFVLDEAQWSEWVCEDCGIKPLVFEGEVA